MLSEYGRNVQKMVSYLKSVEDRDLRNKQAQVVVGIMANLYPHKNDSDAFRHMLWDHLYMIADFDLDIDSPYPVPTPELFSPVAKKVPYTQKRVAQKHYGEYARLMLLSVAEADDAEASEQDKDIVVSNVARYMRQSAYNYNNEYPSNDVILADIRLMTGGRLEAGSESLSGSNVVTNKDQRQRSNNYQQNNSSAHSKNNQQSQQSKKSHSSSGSSSSQSSSNNSGRNQSQQSQQKSSSTNMAKNNSAGARSASQSSRGGSKTGGSGHDMQGNTNNRQNRNNKYQQNRSKSK